MCVCVCVLSHVQIFATPWTAGQQAPLSMEVFRQEYWSGLPFHPPRDLPDPGVQPVGSFTSSATWEPLRLSKTFLLKCGAALSRFLDSLSFPEKKYLKNYWPGTSLVVQGLGLCLRVGGRGLISGLKARVPHAPRSKTPKSIKQKQYCDKFKKD